MFTWLAVETSKRIRENIHSPPVSSPMRNFRGDCTWLSNCFEA